jgi:D-glycero-alpha-D-manno-heptose 1-phosphate guanylyltransferase
MKNEKGGILNFVEKGIKSSGFINGGYFIINKSIFNSVESKKFMFNDFIIENINKYKIGSIPFDDYFIDIGTPNDYAEAQNYFKSNLQYSTS